MQEQRKNLYKDSIKDTNLKSLKLKLKWLWVYLICCFGVSIVAFEQVTSAG